MNAAKLRDRLLVSSFWEQKISSDEEHAEEEQLRKRRSALKKLRAEWSVRLDQRSKLLNKINHELLTATEESADLTMTSPVS